jgi:hypothetical protein
MKVKRFAAAICALLLLLCLTGCASDVYGDWVTEDGQVYSFGGGTMTIDGSDEYQYQAKDGVIQILFTTDMFGTDSSFMMDGTYEIKGNTMYLTIGTSTSLILTRY